MRNTIIILASTLVFAACQGNLQPSAETQQAVKKTEVKAQQKLDELKKSEAAKRIAAGTREAAKGVQQSAGQAIETAGDALAKKGREIQADAKKKSTPVTDTH